MSGCGGSVPDVSNTNDQNIIEAAIAVSILNPDLNEEGVIQHIVSLSNANSQNVTQVIDDITPPSSQENTQESDLGILEEDMQFSFNTDVFPVFNEFFTNLMNTRLSSERIRTVLSSFTGMFSSVIISPIALPLLLPLVTPMDVNLASASASSASSLVSLPSINNILSLINPASCAFKFLNEHRGTAGILIGIITGSLYVLTDEERIINFIDTLRRIYNIPEMLSLTITMAINNNAQRNADDKEKLQKRLEAIYERKSKEEQERQAREVARIAGIVPPPAEERAAAAEEGAAVEAEIPGAKRKRGGKSTKRNKRTKNNKKSNKKNKRTNKRKPSKRRTNRTRK